jgi:hypothetical protein
MRNIYCAECATKLIKSHPEDVAAGMGRRRVWITLERSGLVCDLCCTALEVGHEVQCDTMWSNGRDASSWSSTQKQLRSFKKGDQKWTAQYFNLREQIEVLECDIGAV